MVNKFWRLLVTLAALGLGGCVSSGQPLPTQAPTAVLPTPVSPTANAVLSAADLPASPTPANMAPAAPTTAVTQAPPVVLATAAALPSPPPDAPPAPSATAASDVSADGRAAAIGFSAGGRPLTAYQLGGGPNQIVLVGGMHGGYEWNTVLLAYRLLDYFAENPDKIPETVTLHIIPAANPDGQFVVAGRDGRFAPTDVDAAADNFSGRFNSNGVDLNRNWDCQWQTAGMWRDQEIDAGEFPFSEPETAALRDFFLALQPTAVVFWHSAANGVYGAGCPDLYQSAYALAQLYGTAAGYPVYESFDSYAVTGDASDWLALQNIPAITVELETHESLDWEKNLAGVTAVLKSQQPGGVAP
ncbi:MAG TPA: hypothetical protein ENK32_10540 [Anaerolineae bacterium]|nr:hypothetical protein [Anaerolineae bacterium]